jgi:DNA modification methylase
MPELSPFSQNLSMTRILCGSFEKLKKLPQPEKQRSNHFIGNRTPYSPVLILSGAILRIQRQNQLDEVSLLGNERACARRMI